jgi:hypothetical protein
MEEAVLQYQVETPAEKLFKMSVISIACISLSCCHSFWWRNKSFKSNFDCWSFLVGACLHPSLWNENLNVFFYLIFCVYHQQPSLYLGAVFKRVSSAYPLILGQVAESVTSQNCIQENPSPDFMSEVFCCILFHKEIWKII